VTTLHFEPRQGCPYYGANVIRRVAARLWGARASRSLDDMDARIVSQVRDFLAECAAARLDVFVYTTHRPLAEQDAAVEAGVSWTRRGWHNLLDPETGKPASRAIDYAFRGRDPWAPSHSWGYAREIGEQHGATYEAWHKGDLGHAVWTLGQPFRTVWDGQAKWHTLAKAQSYHH
jgi:hypothetical protein